MAPDRAADLALLTAAALAAGALALGFFGRDQRTWMKDGNSIVGEADMAVDRLLADILRAARPDYGWLSEETADTPERLGRGRVFVVDPIDGTRAFIAGRAQWAVSLAVVEDGRPVVAVLAMPALAETLHAVAGGGAWRLTERLAAAAATSLVGARFWGSRRYPRAAAEAAGVASDGVRFVPSLAYRLALVATGAVDVAIAGPNARDWDLAAADLLVQEAGARLTDLSGERLNYNQANSSHPALVATTPALFDAVAGLVRDVDGRAG